MALGEGGKISKVHCLISINHCCWDSKLLFQTSVIFLGVAPSQDSSDHQDYETFLVGAPELNLHFPLLLGGHPQVILYKFDVC